MVSGWDANVSYTRSDDVLKSDSFRVSGMAADNQSPHGCPIHQTDPELRTMITRMRTCREEAVAELALLLDQYASSIKGYPQTINELLIAAVANTTCANDLVALVLVRHQDIVITELTLRTVACNESEQPNPMGSLMHFPGFNSSVTTEVVERAVMNKAHGASLAELLMAHMGDHFPWSENILIAAARNASPSGSPLESILRHPASVTYCTPRVLAQAAKNGRFAARSIKTILKQTGLAMRLSEDVLVAAAWDEAVVDNVMELLQARFDFDVNITAKVLEAAAGNEKHGATWIPMLLQHGGDDVPLTAMVIEKAMTNRPCGAAVLRHLITHARMQDHVLIEALEGGPGFQSAEVALAAIQTLIRVKGKEHATTQSAICGTIRIFDASALEDVLLHIPLSYLDPRPSWLNAADLNCLDSERVLRLLRHRFFVTTEDKKSTDLGWHQCTVVKFDCNIGEVMTLSGPECRPEALFDAVTLLTNSFASSDLLPDRTSCRAMTCFGIIEQRWGAIGTHILRQLALLFSSNKLETSYEIVIAPRYYLRYILSQKDQTLSVGISKTTDEVCRDILLQVVDFICRALRPAPKREVRDDVQMSISTFDSSLQLLPSTNGDKTRKKPEWTGGEVFLAYQRCFLGEGNCWQQLFDTCFVVADPVPAHNKQDLAKGLEVSFDLMVTLAAVDYEVVVNDKGGRVFAGYFTVLLPIGITEDCAQFHLLVEAKEQIDPFRLGDQIPLSNTRKDFENLRCFLGWCDVAEIDLGTERLQATAVMSQAREVRQSLQFAGLSVGAQLLSGGPTQSGLTVQGNFNLVHHILRFRPSDSYAKMLRDCSRHTALIMDTATSRSWLVPKLSLLLHMAHAWCLVHDACHQIPFIPPHSEIQSVIKALDGHGDDVLVGHGTDAFRLRKLLLGLSINLQATVSLGLDCRWGHYYGFEFVDIVEEPGRGAVMKRVKVKQHWVELANHVDALVVCSGIGGVMHPPLKESSSEHLCQELPSNKDYLAVHVSCLLQIAQRLGGDATALLSEAGIRLHSRRLITLNIVGEPFMMCPHAVGDSETCWRVPGRVQKIFSVSFLSRLLQMRAPDRPQPPASICATGAIVFGDTPR